MFAFSVSVEFGQSFIMPPENQGYFKSVMSLTCIDMSEHIAFHTGLSKKWFRSALSWCHVGKAIATQPSIVNVCLDSRPSKYG